MHQNNTVNTCARAAGNDNLQPLPSALRHRLELAYGADLSAVRVRTGPAADRLARALGADAFTFGPTIYFRYGAYQPGTARGQWLVAHEAAHVVQQAAGTPAHIPAAECERQADQAADLALAGRTWTCPASQHAASQHSASQHCASRVPLIQRHVSFEHRLLGDSPTEDLFAISTNGVNRSTIIKNQIALLSLWQDKPDQVTPDNVTKLCPWIKTLRIGPDQVLATYGEINALPDYLSDAAAIDTLGHDILMPILQVIRQEGYNQLRVILPASDTKPVTFAQAACAPWQLSLVNNIVETTALDTLTQGLGPQGQNHYQGLLARNACHFAPFSWYRWQASYLVARDLATRSFANHDAELARQALVYGGYADHFLEDSFAAGHLVNKTLVMQWFIEWAASQNQSVLPVADWEVIRHITTTGQPDLAGTWLYDPAFPGPSNDPQTAQEADTLVGRLLASSVRADGPRGQFTSYQNYLTFLTSAAAQLASAELHDFYNTNSLWVSSAARTAPYEIWGDDTLLTSANGGTGVRATSEAAQLSFTSLTELINTGRTSITTAQIRDHFPTSAGPSAAAQTDLRTWSTSQRGFCVEQFDGFVSKLKDLVIGFGSPRLGVASQDQEFASRWSVSLPDSGYYQVDNLVYGGRLFTGSNGYVYEIDPVSGKVLHELHLTTLVGGAVTHLATDGTYLFAGVHGYVYAVKLTDWTKPAWYVGVGGSTGYGLVSLLMSGKSLYAGSNGVVYELRPSDGSTVHSVELTTIVGGAETRIATDGSYLYAGVHGYVYGVTLSDWTKPPWYTGVGGLLQYELVSVLAAGNGNLYAGSNGWVYQLRPSDGHSLKSLRLSDLGEGAEVRLATDGTYLFAGIYGNAYGVALSDWSDAAWHADLSGTFSSGPVSVATSGGQLFAGSNGYVYELDSGSGEQLHNLLLTYAIGIGEFDTTVLLDGTALYAGVHGYTNRLLVQHIPAPTGTLLHATHDSNGWHAFVPDFDGAPKASSVFGLTGATGHTEMFAIGTDGTLYHDALDSQGWHGWAPDFDGAPKVTSVFGIEGSTGHTEMFAIGTDSVLYHNTLDSNGWHGWTPNFNNAPKVTSVFGIEGSTGHTEVFAIGTDGTLFHNTLDSNGWHGWTPDFNGAPKITAIFGSEGFTGHTEVFAIGTDATLYHNTLDSNGWHGWTPDFNGAPPMRAITGPTSRPSSVPGSEFFGTGVDGTLYLNTLDSNGWHGWTAGFADGVPAVTRSVFSVAGITGHNELFVIAG